MSVPRTLWALEGAAPDTPGNPGNLAEALRLHVEQSVDGLSTIVMQIGERQQAYLALRGCAQCHLGRCIPGCRVGLLRRALRAGLPGSALRLVPDGFQPRPYTRTILAWPTRDALQLDASLIHPWRDARLLVHWQRSRIGTNQRDLAVGAVLTLGDGGPEPRAVLRAAGWQSRTIPLGHRLGRAQLWPAPVRRRWLQDPHVLLPVAAAAWLIDLPGRADADLNRAVLRSQTHAATIAQQVEAAGARIEFLDLHPDDWTSTLAATTADGDDITPLLAAIAASAGPLQVRDSVDCIVALDPAASRPPGTLPALIRVGTRPDGTSRWRPLSSTHHLVLVGRDLAGVVAGMLAPLVASQPALHVGLLDTADGALALALAGLPQRLPTMGSNDVQELLGVLGGLADLQAAVLVVVYVEDAAVCEAAVVPLLRAAHYRNLSLIIVAPDDGTLPELIRHRLPIIRVRNRQAQWQAPHGHWRWAAPTVLRLPWRERALPRTGSGAAAGGPELQPTAGFWALPAALHDLIDAEDTGRHNQTPDHDDATVLPDETIQQRPEADEGGTVANHPAIVPRHDVDGRLIIEPALLAAALEWTAGVDAGQGITLKALAAGLGLASRVQAGQVVDALVTAGMGTEGRDGWYQLVSVAEAVDSGKLPAGPWYQGTDDRSSAADEVQGERVTAPSVARDMEASLSALVSDAEQSNLAGSEEHQ